jgi:AcrR family transcriptional regulator
MAKSITVRVLRETIVPAGKRMASRTGRRVNLRREDIVSCALRLISREGAGSLTFRAVARELGISPGTLVHYFSNLADLQDEIAAKLYSGVRPLSMHSKSTLRRQLVRHGMDIMKIAEAHPYLESIQGPASAAVAARTTAQCVNVLVEGGIDFERAIVAYSMVAGLAFTWGSREALHKTSKTDARMTEAGEAALGDLLPKLVKLSKAHPHTTAMHRRWLQLCVEGMLP